MIFGDSKSLTSLHVVEPSKLGSEEGEIELPSRDRCTFLSMLCLGLDLGRIRFCRVRYCPVPIVDMDESPARESMEASSLMSPSL